MSLENPYQNINDQRTEEERIGNEIKQYQQDGANMELKAKLFEEIKSRTLYLSREDFVKRAKQEEREDPYPMEDYLGFSSNEYRPIINQEACPEENFPYIVTHEITEALENGPWVDEKEDWRKIHGTPHPQESIDSHTEASYEEYRHAKKDGKLENGHNFVLSMLDKYEKMEKGKPEPNPNVLEKIAQEKRRREKIFEEVAKENLESKQEKKSKEEINLSEATY